MRQDVRARLTFLSSRTHNPSFIISRPGIEAIRNGDYESMEVQIDDGREARPGLGLHSSGFVQLESPSRADVESDEGITRTYYEEVCVAVRSELGAEEVFAIDHTIRSSARGYSGRGVVTHVHSDYTPKSIAVHANRLRREHGILGERRVVQVNVWRPLTEPVCAWPLALADGRTIRAEDLVPCKLFYPDRVGEIYELRHHPLQRWYWFPDMMRSEILIFKGHDSASVVGRVPHTAFDNPETSERRQRRSIEVRVLAFLRSRNDIP